MRIGGVAAFIVVWGLATLSCATQSIAAVFSYQPALGAPVYRFATGEALYWPWSFVSWSLRHRAAFPRPFALADFILVIGNGVGVVLVLLALDARIPKTRRHGESGWATFNEARSAGLFANAGVVLGKCEGELLAYDGPGHVLLIGASRSGKGRGHVVPTLLAWPHSALVLDIKGELADGDARHDFAGTAGFREKLGAVLRFAPTQAKSARFNPLFEVRKGANEVRDVQNVVEIIVDPAGDARHNDFWDRSAKQVLVGLILHVLYAEPDERKTLATVRERLRDLDAVAQHMRQVAHRLNPTSGTPEVHPEVLHAAESYLSGEERVRSGIKATAESFFGLFADPLVAANTSQSDFRLSDLMCAEAPTTLYLQPPPSDATRLMPLMRLLLNQAVRSLMERQTQAADGRDKRHALLLLLDEFPQLGRLSFFETAMGAFAGYGLKAYLVCQSLNHIARAYGRDSVIIDNCHLVTSFAVADAETAKTIAAMAGETWQVIEQESVSRPRALLVRRGSTTFREERRPLILTSEVRSLPQHEQIIFVAGEKPLRCQKIKFDEEPTLRERACASQREPIQLTTAHDWQGVEALGVLAQEPVPRAKPAMEAPLDPQRDLFADARVRPGGIADRALAGFRGPDGEIAPHAPGPDPQPKPLSKGV